MVREFLDKEEILTWGSRKRARFVNSLSGFKSATLIGTYDPEYGDNLSIVSSVVHLGSTPPMMGFVLRPPGKDAHTYKNIIKTGICTFSHVNEDIIEQSHQTSARYPRNSSEFEEVGLTSLRINGWKAPCVEESRVRMGLNLIDDIELANGCRFLTCEVNWFDVDSRGLCEDGYVDLNKLGGVSISGLDGYHKTPGIFRLSYAKTDVELRKIFDFNEVWDDNLV
tara:strand:- start:1244 stop:1915 length:672 start_codon:yes stop_codon:yes gene_type:complete